MNPLTSIEIFNPFGVRYQYNGSTAFPITDNCERKTKLMGEDSVRLSFNLSVCVPLAAFSFIEYDGQTFFAKEDYFPTPQGSLVEDGVATSPYYKYDITFVSLGNMLDKHICFRHVVVVEDEWDEPEINISGDLNTLYQIVIGSINVAADRVRNQLGNGTRYVAMLKSIVANGAFDNGVPVNPNLKLSQGTELSTFSFSGENIFNVCSTIAKTFTDDSKDTEWYITEDAQHSATLHFSKCVDEETGVTQLSDYNYVNTADDRFLRPYVSGGVLKCEYASKWNDVPQVLIPFGADRNMSGVSKKAVDDVSKMMYTFGKRVRLDGNHTYHVYDKKNDNADVYITTDANGAFALDDVHTGIEKVEFFEDVYPQCHFRVTKVDIRNKRQDGYLVPEYIIQADPIAQDGITSGDVAAMFPIKVEEGGNLSIHFDSGFLNGRDFDVSNQSRTIDSGQWKLILTIIADGSFEDGTLIPSGNFIPREKTQTYEGDTFSLYGMKMPDAYIEMAKQDLAQASYEKLQEIQGTRPEVKCTSDPITFSQNSYKMYLGKRMAMKSELFGNSVFSSRVVSFSHKLTKPNNIEFSLASAVVQGTLATIGSNVANLETAQTEIIRAQQNLSKRGWRDAAEMQAMLESLSAEMMLIGDAHNQFSLTSSINVINGNVMYGNSYHFSHLDISSGVFQLTNPDSGDDTPRVVNPVQLFYDEDEDELGWDIPYYLYYVIVGETGHFALRQTKTNNSSYYLVGILSSEFKDGTTSYRVFNRTHGFTRVSGGTITTEQIQDVNRQLIIDFSSNPPRIIARNGAEIIGNIKFLCPDGTKVGGFTGINGGLLMTEMLQLMDGNAVTAGMSGRNDNVLLWGGGTYEDALNAAQDNYKKEDGNAITTLLKKDGRGKIGCFQVVDEDTISVTTDGGTLYISNKEIDDFVQQFTTKTANAAISAINEYTDSVSKSDSGVVTYNSYMGADIIPSGRYNLNVKAFSKDVQATLTNVNGGDAEHNRVGISVRIVAKVYNVLNEIIATQTIAQATASIGDSRSISRATLSCNDTSIAFVNPKNQRLYISYELHYDYYMIVTSGWVAQVSLDDFPSTAPLMGSLVNVASSCVFAKDGIAVIQNSSIGFYVRNNVSGQMQIIVNGLPTSQPTTSGQLWNSGGVIRIAP